jgi:hypothetical protein
MQEQDNMEVKTNEPDKGYGYRQSSTWTEFANQIHLLLKKGGVIMDVSRLLKKTRLFDGSKIINLVTLSEDKRLKPSITSQRYI